MLRRCSLEYFIMEVISYTNMPITVQHSIPMQQEESRSFWLHWFCIALQQIPLKDKIQHYASLTQYFPALLVDLSQEPISSNKYIFLFLKRSNYFLKTAGHYSSKCYYTKNK